MAQKKKDKSAKAPTAKLSPLLDTRVIYCGHNLDQPAKLPDHCIQLKGTFRPATRA